MSALVIVSEPSPNSATWSDVLAASAEDIGSNPRTIWENALAGAGSTTVTTDGEEHTSNCPAVGHGGGHGDEQRSMRWRQAADGQILFVCLAGCEPQVILDALSLSFVQLKWSRTEYSYRSDVRELLAIHVKQPQANGKKKFFWERIENDGRATGKGPTWEPVLWCWPDLLQFAEQARVAGKRIHLTLCEGEKDCISVAAAYDRGWTPADQSGAEWVHLTTTSADGAASWSRALTEQLISLDLAQITILCDSDLAGSRRSALITDSLHEANAHVAIQSLNWLGQAGIGDATEAIHEYGRHWLQRAIPTDDADVYFWCSVETGWLKEADAADTAGNPTGRRALHRVVRPGQTGMREEAIAKWPLRVDAVTKDTLGREIGWEVDLGSGGRALLRTTDLDGSNLERWNAQHGLFIVPTRGLTASLRAYLGYHGNNVGSMTVYDHEGWVDSERFVTKAGLLIGPEGESATAALGGIEQSGGADWYYGLGDEHEAAAHLCQLLTFRTMDESGVVMAWLAAVAARPRALAASGASFVPMLQIPGASGIGKTSFLKLATRLFGFSGNPISNVTSAGLVRTLALTTGVVWIDDFTDYDDTIRDIIRSGITGGGRTRGTTSSERGIVRDEAHAALINSGEHAFDANERAMSQRSVILEFAHGVQGRLSKASGQDQYQELEVLGVAKEDKGAGLSRWAGTVIRGIWAAAQRVDAEGRGKGTGNGVRGQAAWEFVRYGAICMCQWLRDSGEDADRINKLEVVILTACDREAANAARREKSGADVYLVQELVPRYLTFARGHMDAAVSARIESGKLDIEEIKLGIRKSWRDAYGEGPGRAEQGPRPVVVLSKPAEGGGEEPLAVAVCAEVLYQWASSSEGQRSGASKDERHVSATGIAMQLKQVANKDVRDTGDKATSDGCFRVRLGQQMQVPRYRLITEPEVIAWLCG